MESEDLSRPEWRRALPEIVSDRVTLRELRLSDAAALYRAACTPEIVRHTWPPPSSIVNGLDGVPAECRTRPRHTTTRLKPE